MLNTEIKVYPGISGIFTVAYTHPFTKRRVRSVFNTKTEAERHVEILAHQFKQNPKENSDEILISDLMIQFLKKNSKNELTRARKLFVDFCDTFGSLKIKDITTDSLRVWLNQLKIENDYKEGTMFGCRVKINIFFRYLIKTGLIQTSPVEGIVYKKGGLESKQKRMLLSPETIEDLLVKAKNYSPGYFYPIFLMFVETGAKTDEIIEMTWDCVDFNRGTINFPERQTLQKRGLPMSKALQSSLKGMKPIADVVFTHVTEKKFRKKQLTIALLDFKKHFGIKEKWSYLDLRHSFAFNFLTNGGNIRELKILLGHNSVYTMIDLYGEYRKVPASNSASPFED